ncbi:MAG: hypothetical protein Q9170_004919 [Blastenia crenularia]
MLNSKTYVITSIDLVNAVNRNPKILAFNPFVAFVGKRITGHDQATSQIVQHNLNGENGPGYVIDIHDGTVSSLAPGPGLNAMTATMLTEAMTYFKKLPGRVDLFAWTKKMVTMASTRGIYGEDNPFGRDVERMVRNFWQFDEDLNMLILDVMPGIIAPKGNRARQELGQAFSRYFDHFDEKPSNSAALTKHRHSVNTHYGLTSFNKGRLEVGVLLGILANTIPTIFYIILHVLSDEQLLNDVREEILSVAVRLDEGKPILQVSQGSSVRYVREDILLQDRWLLKKGMVVQMPQAVMHSDPAAWGSDVNGFNPRRFLKSSASAARVTEEKAGKINMAAYRPFGGGASLCPGRHFVAMEAMVLTAVMVMGYEVTPVGDRGWKIPAQKQESMATNVFPPEEDIQIEVREREGWEDFGWEMK